MSNPKLRGQSWLLQRKYTIRQRIHEDDLSIFAGGVVPFGALLFAESPIEPAFDARLYLPSDLGSNAETAIFLGCVTTPGGEKISADGYINISADVEIEYTAYNKYVEEYNAETKTNILQKLSYSSKMITGNGRLYITQRV